MRNSRSCLRMLASERFLGSLWSMKIPRRVFVGSSLAAIAGGPLIAANSKPGLNARREADASAKPPLVISTWPFGKPANDRTLEVFRSGKSGLDAVEQGCDWLRMTFPMPAWVLEGFPRLMVWSSWTPASCPVRDIRPGRWLRSRIQAPGVHRAPRHGGNPPCDAGGRGGPALCS